MRRLILTFLLATTAAMPTMAQEKQGRDRDRDERQQAREERRAERAERAVEQQAARQPEVQQQQQQAIQPTQVERQRGERGNREQRRSESGGWEQRGSESRRAYRHAQRQTSGATYAPSGQVLSEQRDISRTRNRSLLGQVNEQVRQRQGQVVVHRDGDRDGRYASRYSDHRRQWNSHWRGDRNYDWRNYRNRHRSVFRLGNYWDPYGSRYRRFSIGYSLFPSYYQSNYWLNDPWMYRLPPAYGPYRWVRYYDDALLVNIYTGQVVDVEHNFFW